MMKNLIKKRSLDHSEGRWVFMGKDPNPLPVWKYILYSECSSKEYKENGCK